MTKILVMGVSGSGKTTIGRRLARELACPFIEGDDFHPPKNIEKMKSGQPLDDDDRAPWLDRLYHECLSHSSCVLACSALKESYRRALMQEGGINKVIFLSGDFDKIHQRMSTRDGHFMPTELLQSQFDTLEEPEEAIRIEHHDDIDQVINDILSILSEIHMKRKASDIGLLGLGVMGKSLSLNLSGKGFRLSVYNLPLEGQQNVVDNFCRSHPEGNFFGAVNPEDFVKSIARPRKIILMIKSGQPVDDMIELLSPHIDHDDMIIDAGNSFYKDTVRRAKAAREKGFYFIGTGVSGGEEGALKGPSIMPSGPAFVKTQLAEIFERISAKADGQACTYWFDGDGSGHFIKMVHNGIEYADMQLLSEAYAIARNLGGFTNDETADLFSSWKQSAHNSFLIDISIDILRKRDTNNQHILDQILDVAGHKGTGLWTSREALELGVAVPTISAAMNQRIISAESQIRKSFDSAATPISEAFTSQILVDGLLLARYIALAEGFHLIQRAAGHYGWEIELAMIAQVWRGGCIIRSDMLPFVMQALGESTNHLHLFESQTYQQLIEYYSEALQTLVSICVQDGLPAPALSAAANYLSSMRSPELPINLIQAQRDYFGAHTYRLKEQPDIPQHTNWKKADHGS